MPQDVRLHPIRQSATSRAVVFLHGFTGDRDDTWDKFPSLLGSELQSWDIFTLGYPTTLLPDVTGIWSADPDLPALSMHLQTQLHLSPVAGYETLALIAHSIGGLIVQRALLDDSVLAERVSHVILFGTPSDGIRKASWFRFWKRSIKNMAKDSEFITGLRTDWAERFPALVAGAGDALDRPFLLLPVAGTKDQFVPLSSSLDPFPENARRVVDGNHVDIVKPQSGSGSLRLVIDALSSDPDVSAASICPPPKPPSMPAAPTENQVVKAALALDHVGERAKAIAMLEQHAGLGTDVKGVLGGRYEKDRIWLDTEDASYATKANGLYTKALAVARQKRDSEQIYYHAINVAFLNLVAFGREDSARKFAEEALKHVSPSAEDVWSLATRAEANLYLGQIDVALKLYRQLPGTGAEPWQVASTSLQAVHIARALGNRRLRDEIDAIFSPGARKVFVSYSHADLEWLERLKIMVKPYLHDSDIEFWDDSKIKDGELWRQAISRALESAGVVVALGSARFLASDFITDYELPEIAEGARKKELHLIWLALDHAGYETSPIYDFQCVNDPDHPLTDLDENEQQKMLLKVARRIKEAAQPTQT